MSDHDRLEISALHFLYIIFPVNQIVHVSRIPDVDLLISPARTRLKRTGQARDRVLFCTLANDTMPTMPSNLSQFVRA